MNKQTIILSAAIAGLMAAGTTAVTANAAAKVKCEGVNACKGTGACKTAQNSCKGQNACKGQGFKMMTDKSCEQAKAKAKDAPAAPTDGKKSEPAS